jgi:hypothetical protein
LLLIVPGLYLMTIWAVIVPVIVIERSGALASFGRSRQLVRGHGWHVFATLVLIYIIQIIVQFLLSLIFGALPHVLGDGLSSVISGTLISPFIALVVTLVYYRLLASSTSAAGGGPYGEYQQQPQPSNASYGGYGQPPQGGDPWGGYNPPPLSGGYGQPPQSGGYGGYNQPPQGGSEPPTQQMPRNGGGWEPPTQQMPRDGGGWEPPPQPPR